MQETWVQSLGWEDPLEKETATHSLILAWEIPWTEEPGGVQSVGHKEVDRTKQLTLSLFSAFSWIAVTEAEALLHLFKVCWDTETRTSESQAVWAKGSAVGVSEPTRECRASSWRAATGSQHRAGQPQGEAALSRAWERPLHRVNQRAPVMTETGVGEVNHITNQK